MSEPDDEVTRMTSDINAFNKTLIEEFRANDGRVSGMFSQSPLLLLTHTGAKSGEQLNLHQKPNFDAYAAKTDREIPVVVLERV